MLCVILINPVGASVLYSNNPTGYSQVVEEKNTNGILTRSYHLGHQRFAMTDHTNGGDISYYNFDGHGSIRGLSNENGDVVEEYDFDSYGILIGFRKDTGGGMIDHDPSELGGLSRNEFLFAGEQWDADMGMYYNRARYYDVENGRFNGMDDWEGNLKQTATLNKYLYGDGNPVTNIDPTGHFSIAEISLASAINKNLRALNNTKRVRTVQKRLVPVYKALVRSFMLFSRGLAYAKGDLRMMSAVTKTAKENGRLWRKFKKKSNLSVATVNSLLHIGAAMAKAASRESGSIIKDNGLPDFSNGYHEDKPVVAISLQGTRREDFKHANRIRAGKPLSLPRLPNGKGQPRNYTWHHHEIVGVMELVETDLHRSEAHHGGVWFWKILKDKPTAYKKIKKKP